MRHVNESNIVGQQLIKLLDVACCGVLLGVVAQTFEPKTRIISFVQ